DLAPPGMRPDQHLLDQILGQGAVAGQYRGEPQHARQPIGREFLEGHHTSTVGFRSLHATSTPICCDEGAKTSPGQAGRSAEARCSQPSASCPRPTTAGTPAAITPRTWRPRLHTAMPHDPTADAPDPDHG